MTRSYHRHRDKKWKKENEICKSTVILNLWCARWTILPVSWTDLNDGDNIHY